MIFGRINRYLKKRRLSIEPIKITTATNIVDALKDSDDFHLWAPEFITAATWLINRGVFTLKDFKYNGGWVRSTNRVLKKAYFMMPMESPSVQSIVFLNPSAGTLYRSYNGKTVFLRLEQK